MKKVALFFQHLGPWFKNLWSKEPQAEAVISKVINGIETISADINTPEADIIEAAFGKTIGGKTAAEVKDFLPLALEAAHAADDGLKATEAITDPTEKANLLITTVLKDIAAMPEAKKSAQTITVIAGIVSKILGMDLTEATHLVTAKQLELQAAAATETAAQ